MTLRHLAATLFVATAPLAAAPADPAPADFLHPGEVLEFRMSYGIFGNAGGTRIETSLETLEGLPHYRIRVTTKTRGLVNSLYPITNDSDSLLDAATGRPLQIRIAGKAGSRPEQKTTVFDYARHAIVHTDSVRPGKSTTAVLPDEPAYDLMVAVLKARAWNLQPGESRRVLCTNDADFYTIELTALALETITTPAGQFDTVVLEPKQLGELKGFFRRGGSMKVWISRGEHPQVVRIDTHMKFGTISAKLVQPRVTPLPPTPPVAAAP